MNLESLRKLAVQKLAFLVLTSLFVLLPLSFLVTVLIAHPDFDTGRTGSSLESITLLGTKLTSNQAIFYATVSGSIFTGTTFLATLITLYLTLNDNRKDRAHKLVQQWNSSEIRKDVRLIRENIIPLIKKHTDNPRSVYKMIRKNGDHYDAMIHVLNTLEDWAIAIESGFVDRDVIEQSMVPAFRAFYADFRPIITYIREANGDFTILQNLESYVESPSRN